MASNVSKYRVGNRTGVGEMRIPLPTTEPRLNFKARDITELGCAAITGNGSGPLHSFFN